MAKDVKFTIKLNIDGNKLISTASTNCKRLAQELGIAADRSDNLRNALLSINNTTVAFKNAFSGLQQLTGVMQQFTQANAVQQVGGCSHHHSWSGFTYVVDFFQNVSLAIWNRPMLRWCRAGTVICPTSMMATFFSTSGVLSSRITQDCLHVHHMEAVLAIITMIHFANNSNLIINLKPNN